MPASKKIIEANSLDWLPDNRDLGSIITSLPDASEIDMPESHYRKWFQEALKQVFESTSERCPTIFYQTDRKIKNHRISKANMVMNEANRKGLRLIWHKIVLRVPVGKVDNYRPGYSHLLCFGDEHVKAGRNGTDVMEMGGQLYPNGFSLNAARFALEYCKPYSLSVCDPFCGKGTIPALAAATGFKSVIGVDIDPAQCETARSLRVGSIKPVARGTAKRGRLFK